MQRHSFVTVIVITSARRPDTMSFSPLSLPLGSYPSYLSFYLCSSTLPFLKVTQSSMYRDLLCPLIRFACPTRQSPRSAIACVVSSLSPTGKIPLVQTFRLSLNFQEIT